MAKFTNCWLQYVHIYETLPPYIPYMGVRFHPHNWLINQGGSIYPAYLILNQNCCLSAEMYCNDPVWFFSLDPTTKHVRVGVKHTISVQKCDFFLIFDCFLKVKSTLNESSSENEAFNKLGQLVAFIFHFYLFSVSGCGSGHNLVHSGYQIIMLR